MYQSYGVVIKSIGGLFTVRLLATPPDASPAPLDGCTAVARGRGNLRRTGELLVGDRVKVLYDDNSFSRSQSGETIPSPDGSGIVIDEILPRRSSLIRPPMANLDLIFVTVAAASPDPLPETIDKLLAIAEYNKIEPVFIVTKEDKNSSSALSLANLYRNAGYKVFVTGKDSDDGIRELQNFVQNLPAGTVAAFSGASGVGKSTLLNRIFPDLALETGEISRRIERGKNTTRCVTLYPTGSDPRSCLVADTPGFTMLDFERFHFFDLEDLPTTFREFLPYIGKCRFVNCTHTKEADCAVVKAVKEGNVAASRHESYCSLYEVLKKKKY